MSNHPCCLGSKLSFIPQVHACPEMTPGHLKTRPALSWAACFQLLDMNDGHVASGFKMGQRYICPRMGSDIVFAMILSKSVANKNNVIIFSLVQLLSLVF